jgi:hypothetical protein
MNWKEFGSKQVWPDLRLLLFGKFSVRISVGALTTRNQVFGGFPQPFQENSGILPRLDHNSFLPNPYQFTIHQASYHCTLYSIDIKSVVKLIAKKLDV